MTGIRHAKVSGLAATGSATDVDGADWDAEHDLSAFLTTQGDMLYMSAGGYVLRTTGTMFSVLDTYSGSPSALGDGSIATGWVSNTEPGSNSWIKIDLGVARTISRIRIYQGGYAAMATINVQYGPSLSGAWTTLETLTGGVNGVWQQEDLPPTSARYWQLDPTLANGSDFSWGVLEVELYENIAADLGRVPTTSTGRDRLSSTGIILEHQATPGTPAAGTTVIYAKSDGRLYSKGPDGVERGPF